LNVAMSMEEYIKTKRALIIKENAPDASEK
jgi:hypothetical protein